MSLCLLPTYSFKSITDISPEFLVEKKIKFLMIDLDNTLAAYDEHCPSTDVHYWLLSVKDIGITPAIVSNTTRMMRVFTFAETFDVCSVARARKPSPANMLHLMKSEGFSADESALIGDQIFTDVLAANLAGITSIIINPRKFTNIFLAIRYFFELPFRFFTKNKIQED